jgi:hypothetical protein
MGRGNKSGCVSFVCVCVCVLKVDPQGTRVGDE